MRTTSTRSPLARLSARFSGIPLPRLRRVLLALYLLVAAADATGKALAADPRVNAMVRGLLGGRADAMLRHAARPSGNFEIFRAASRHLVAGQDLYAEYPAEHTDRFKYSPTFALLFVPLAWIPWPIALFLWSALNALLLFVAVEKVLPHRRALLAMGLLLLEVLRGMQNAQSNALVAALIVLAFAWTERRRQWSTAFAVGLGACVKIFPLAALTFAVPRRRALSTGLAAGAIGVVLLMLPLALLSPAALAAQYASWTVVEAGDAARAVGRRAVPAALPLLGAAVRGAVQPPGRARELPHRVHRRDHLVHCRAAPPLAHCAVWTGGAHHPGHVHARPRRRDPHAGDDDRASRAPLPGNLARHSARAPPPCSAPRAEHGGGARGVRRAGRRGRSGRCLSALTTPDNLPWSPARSPGTLPGPRSGRWRASAARYG